jgi:hypothetical protein
MKPDWDKLTAEFADSKTSLVADVDCTSDDGKKLCEVHKVTGYPTIKYGDPSELKDYSGGRTYADFKKFAEENLGPTCGPDNLDLCTDEDKALIEKFQKMDMSELDAAIEEIDAKVKTLGEKSAAAVAKLNGKIEETKKEVEAKKKKDGAAIKKETKKHGLGMMKKVLAAAKTNDAKDDKKKKKGKKEL